MATTETEVDKKPNPVYQPLGPHQTRRVWIKPQNGVLYFELEVISLGDTNADDSPDSNPEYVAVSYTWGKLDTVAALVKGVDGQFYPIYVTKTLLMLLEYVLNCSAFPRKPALWIDQLSIDQNNHEEKISQIRMMKEIYEASRYVLIWLGPPDIDSSIAMKRIRNITLQFRKVASLGEKYEEDNGLLVTKFLPMLTGPKTEENYDEWKAMLKLLDRPWFSRLWIIQEGTSHRVFAEKSLVLCGTDVVFFDDFIHLWRLMANTVPWYWNDEFTDYLTKLGHQSHATFNLLGDFWMQRQMSSWHPLLELLHFGRNFDATDPRDKIFGLAAFATDTDSGEHRLQISYNQSVEHTFINFVIWYVRTYGNLDFLGGLQRQTLTNVPDWVPDWTAKNSRQLHQYYEVARTESRVPMYWSCGKERLNKLSITGDLGNIDTLQALTVSGIRLTSVEPWYPRLEDCGKFGNKMIKSQCPLNAAPLSHVLARTLCLDSTTTVVDRLPTGKRGAYYKSWRHCDEHENCFVNLNGVPGLLPNVKNDNALRDFFMLQPTVKQDEGVMGLGEKGLQLGDEIWVLEGGKMLYLLRPWSLPRDAAIRVLDVTGTPNQPVGRQYSGGTTMYQLVGEAFVLGLMDGEALEMLGDLPARPRPACLREMDQEFRSISILHPELLSPKETSQNSGLLNIVEMNERRVRLGVNSYSSKMTQFTDKRRYWTPGVIDSPAGAEVPQSLPQADLMPFLTVDVE